MSHWVAEGRTLGKSLRRFHAVVVAGADPDATAGVALGIAQVQSDIRHVVLGDLLGDAPAFASMRPDDDHHGLVDAFDYGISLGRVSRQVAANPQLQFAPTGSVINEYGELLTHPRWARVVASFAEADHLLIVAAPLEAANVDELVRRFDGLILVDGIAPARVEESRIIARVVARRDSLAKPIPAVAAPVEPPPPMVQPSPQNTSATAPARPTVKARAAVSALATAPPTGSGSQRRQTTVLQAFAKPVGLGAAVSVLAAVLVFWLAAAPFAGRPRPDNGGTVVPTVVGSTPLVAKPQAIDPNLLDPADSGAAVYAVQIMAANTQSGASLKLQEDGGFLPAATYAPVEISGRLWFKVLTGAYMTRGGADSLLAALREQRKVDSVSPGIVVRVPYAVLVDSVPPSATVTDLLKNLRDGRQLPVYALAQPSRWIWILAGAFETRSQAEKYAESIRATATLAEPVLRQGRTF